MNLLVMTKEQGAELRAFFMRNKGAAAWVRIRAAMTEVDVHGKYAPLWDESNPCVMGWNAAIDDLLAHIKEGKNV